MGRVAIAQITGALEYTCETCGLKIVLPEDGIIYVRVDDIIRASMNDQEYEKKTADKRFVGIDDLLALGPPAKWRVAHAAFACSSTDDEIFYWFRLDRISWMEQVLHWTANLMRKPWLTQTDWHQFLYEIAPTE